MLLLGIAVAGALGALARYGLSGAAHRWLGAGFPWGTLFVNLLGCFVLGLLMELVRRTGWVPAEMRAILAIGFLGSLTTFSTFGFETWRALESGEWAVAGLNVVLNLIGGLAFVVAGSMLARWLAAARVGL
jgi:CrcB protein